MPKIYTPEQQAERAMRKAKHKAKNDKIAKFKHTMEIIRTICAICAVLLNVAIITHILGLW